MTLPTAAIAFSSWSPAVCISADVAPACTGAGGISSFGAVAGKMSLIAACVLSVSACEVGFRLTFVALLGFGCCGAFSTDMSLG